LHPDVVIMDSQMPNMDGVETTRHVKQTIPSIGIQINSTGDVRFRVGLDVVLKGLAGLNRVFSVD